MNLKKIRMQKDITQREVADGLGCSATVYSRYETGERQPSIEMLLKLSEFFGVSIDYIVGNREITAPTFSQYEIDLVMASRAADERSREDAMLLLNAHAKPDYSNA